ncbi:DUF6082 family protein [Streptomyces sp. NPDC002668]|uniref:DUF6082 family protein n=1 Tax=Streptomyces sp. NPDC002668 TaxID=3154422 RepID=UPI00332C9E5B
MDWAELSDISQAYAAVSVPLTAAALLGAIFSLTYQARQARVSHVDTTNSTHRALLLEAFGEPCLQVCWGPPPRPIQAQRWKQFTYTNMIVSYWHSQYVLDGVGEAALRSNATRLFRGEVGREYWTVWGAGWREAMSGQGRKSQRFIRIVERAFEAAESEGPPIPASQFFIPDEPGAQRVITSTRRNMRQGSPPTLSVCLRLGGSQKDWCDRDQEQVPTSVLQPLLGQTGAEYSP